MQNWSNKFVWTCVGTSPLILVRVYVCV